MSDELEKPSESTILETKPELREFKEVVSKADGTLIALKKTTTDGKKLFIAARHLANPFTSTNEHSDPNFYGWEDRSLPITSVLLVDIYTESDSLVTPIGHMDWWIDNDYANGGGNMHQAPLPKNDHERFASNKWNKYDYTAFKVIPEYHKQGLGSLLLASSSVALTAAGISKFYTGGLLDPARKTYERFGIKTEDFKGNILERHLPIERLSQSPQVDRSILEFV